MTLQEWMSNPMGKGEASLPGREYIVAGLNDRYHRVIQKKSHQFEKSNYFDPRTNEYYIHVIVPSESERDNTYDVVFRFLYDKDDRASLVSLRNAQVQFFCNSPGFAYSFAYVYNEYGLLIPSLERKFPSLMLKKAPQVRNRFEMVGYDKYIYFAAKYLIDREKTSLFRSALQVSSRKYNERVLYSKVRNLETIEAEYQEAKIRLASKGRQKKAVAKRPNQSTINKPIGAIGQIKKPVKPVKPVSKTKAVKKPVKAIRAKRGTTKR